MESGTPVRHGIAKFNHDPALYRCPLCREALTLDRSSLRCANRHTFDISSKGFVSVLRGGNNESDLYDRSFFEHRSAVFSAGMYDHVIRACCDSVENSLATAPQTRSLLPESANSFDAPRVVDAGCGEGHYMRRLEARLASVPSKQTLNSTDLIAFDISREAVALASRGGGDVEWLAADLANIPLRDGSVDCIANVFSPANYAEFTRILRPGGTLVKIVPGPHHVAELRKTIVDAGLRKELRYSNDDVLQGISAHMRILNTTRVSATTAVDDALLRDFMAMTPVMFHIDQQALELSELDRITIEADVIVASAM
jgi:23S rRNA (guanine745-N1)-methyltransferase